MARKVAINVTLDSDLLERVDKLADKLEFNRSEFVNKIIKQNITQAEREVALITDPFLIHLFRFAAKPAVIRAYLAFSGEKVTAEDEQDIQQIQKRLERAFKITQEERELGRSQAKGGKLAHG